MSSLNKAFIQVYKKSDRPIAKEASGGPHFSIESSHAPVVATAATVKPVVPMQEIAQVAPAIAESEATYVRIDRSEDLASALQPWLTSISTIGIDGYISTAKRKNDAAVEPPTGEKPLAPQTKQDRGVVETTVAVESPSKEEAPQVQFFRTDVAHLEPKGSGATSVAYHGRMPSRPILGSRSSTLARAMPSAVEPSPAEEVAAPSNALPGIEEQPAIQEDRAPTRRSEHAWEKVHSAPFPAANPIPAAVPSPVEEAAPSENRFPLEIVAPVEDLAPSELWPPVVYHSPPKEATTASQAPSSVEIPFQAVWEVDSFQWPDIVMDVQRREPKILNDVGKHLVAASETGLRVLAVTSERACQGRSTVAICLARSAAKCGLRVALIDADLHHPDLGDQLNLEVAHGWEEAIASGLPLEEAAIHSLEDRITLLPIRNPAKALQLAPDHPKVQNILKRLAESFDMVIVDSQHLSHPSSRLVGSGIDTPIHAAVLVVDRVQGDEAIVEDCMRRLSRQGIESVGIVENFQ